MDVSGYYYYARVTRYLTAINLTITGLCGTLDEKLLGSGDVLDSQGQPR